MEKNLDEIRGDINAFAKMVSAVDFAVSVAEKLKENQNSLDAHDGIIATRQAEIERLNAELAKAKADKDEAEKTAKLILEGAHDDAAAIRAKAQRDGEDIIGEANKKVGDIQRQEGELKIKLADTKSQYALEEARLNSIQAEREKLTGSIKESLQKVQV